MNVKRNKLAANLERDLVMVDVGCRWGFADRFIQYLDVFQLYGFDPDRDECDRLEKLYGSNRISLVPLALADHEGESTLNVTKEPACSSMFEPIIKLVESSSALDCARKVAEAKIQHTTLDHWAVRSGIEYVDHIKIDTQGAELLVLKGAEKILESVRCLEVEVEFNPIYEGQVLFSDVDAFLRKKGFVLWKLTNMAHYGRDAENSIELGEDCTHYDDRSEVRHKWGGQLYWADAHYVRAEIADAEFTSSQQLIRDIVLMESLNYLDLEKRLKKTLGAKDVCSSSNFGNVI